MNTSYVRRDQNYIHRVKKQSREGGRQGGREGGREGGWGRTCGVQLMDHHVRSEGDETHQGSLWEQLEHL